MTVKEAAAYLKVDRSTIYDWCERELLCWYQLKTGGGRRFKRSDLDDLLERRGGGSPGGG